MDIIENNAKELWKRALHQVRKNGVDFKDNDNRVCREVQNLVLHLQDSLNAEIDEPINDMIGTKKWIYPSKEELSSIMFKEFAAPIYDYTYGGRIFSFENKLDQINNFIVPLLRKDPNSRRAIIVVYNPLEDSDIQNKNSPGIIYIQCRIKEGRLNLTCHIRSNDLFFGWPANIYQIFHLQKFIAEKLAIAPGDIITLSNSAHVFQDDFESIKELIGVDEF